MDAKFNFPMRKLRLSVSIVRLGNGENIRPHSFEIVKQLIIKGHRVWLISKMIHIRGRMN